MTLDYIRWMGSEDHEYVQSLFSHSRQLILYHGTCSEFKDDILKFGLLPPNLTGNSVYEDETFSGRSLKSQPDKVYFGTKGSAFSLGANTARKYGGDIVVFRFLMNVKNLLPDEDSNKNCPLESLAWEGCCSHQGAVRPENVLGYFVSPNQLEIQEKYHAVRSEPDCINKIEKNILNFEFQ